MKLINSAVPRWAATWGVHGALAALGLGLALSAQAQQQVSRSVAYTYDPNNGQVLTETVDPGGTHCAKTTYEYDGQGNKLRVRVQYCGNSTDPAVAFADRLTVNWFNPQDPIGLLPRVPAGTFLNLVNTGIPNAAGTGFDAANVLSQTKATYHPAYGVPLTQTAVALNNTALSITSKTELDALGRVSRVLTPVGRDAANALVYTSTEQKRVYCTGPLKSTDATELQACLNVNQTIDVTVDSKMLFTPTGETTTSTTATAVTAYYIETVPKDSAGNVIGARSRVHFDALHREIAKESEAYDKQWTMSLTVYDRLGQAASSWSGFYGRDAAGQYQAPPAELRQWAAKRDLVHRPTESRQFFRAGAGEAAKELAGTTEYMGLSSKTTTPGPNGEWRTTIAHKYGNGQIAQTVDAYGATLNNAYDAVGNLVQTLDPLGNTSTITYTPGTARFKVAMKDPNQGQWQYTYNALGELVKQIDGKGQATTLEYDRIGRLIKKNNPTQNGEWRYSRGGIVCANGLPKLCQTIAGNTSTGKEITSQTLAYDTLGRGTKATVKLADRTWVSESSYDTLGRLATQKYPTGFTVGYGYSAANGSRLPGVLERVFDSTTVNTTSRHFWRIDTVPAAEVFNARGQLQKAHLGKDTGTDAQWVTQDDKFDPISGKAFALTAANQSGAGALNHNYRFDEAGNVVTRQNSLVGTTETFVHDKLSRLTNFTMASTADASAARSVEVQYNAIGNILYKSDAGAYTYHASGSSTLAPHAVQAVNGTNYVYDANGALESTTGTQVRAHTWTAFNQPATMAFQGRSVIFKYDESYKRVEEVITNGSTVRTVHLLHPDNQGGLGFEREVITVGGSRTRNENRHYISVGGAVVAVVKTLTPVTELLTTGALNGSLSTAAADANLVNYWHKDALGSIVAISDRDGNVIEKMAFDPWGRRLQDTGRLVDGVNPAHGDRGFTGHEHLDEIGYVHMNGRIYDPLLGRFLSVDPVIGDPNDLQFFNRYSYVVNRPLMLTDPSGECPVCIAAFVAGFIMTQEGNKYWKIVGQVVMFIAAQGMVDAGLGEFGGTGLGGNSNFTAIGQANTFNTGGIGNSMLAAGGTSLVLTGDPEQAMVSALSAGAFTYAGANFSGPGLVAAHAVIGCAQGALSGGKCGPSALSAAAGKGMTLWADGQGFGPVGNGVATTIIGGTASVIGGGKFSNGAAQAAFGYVFNYLANCGSQCMKREGYEPTQYANGAVCNAKPAACTAGTGTDEQVGQAAIALMVFATLPIGAPVEAAAVTATPRLLTAGDLGLTGSIARLDGTIAVVGTELRLTVSMIEGKLTSTMAQSVAQLNSLAASVGATTISIQATIANSALARALQMQGWTFSPGKVAPYTDTISRSVK